ncbi:MAG: permease prefix domain 1-containing protein [Anaerotignum sp.]|nr:permease prefix domain 1-containing protein [Anaerotignum sp.]
MRVPDWEEYLKQVLSHVKFKYDHNSIYFELQNHMEDRYEDFITEGMEEDEAQKAVLACMGDADEIGEELNQAHSPVLGWIWRILKDVLIVLIIINILPMFSLVLTSVISIFDMYRVKNDSPLVYTIDVDYKEKVYDTTYMIDKILYYEDNTLEIRYATWTNPFSDSIKWNHSLGIQHVYVDEVEIARGGGGWKGVGYFARGYSCQDDVPFDATRVAFSVAINNEVSIDLTEGRVLADES